MKKNNKTTQKRQRYSETQIAQAIEIINQSGRDFNFVSRKTGIKTATLKSWWYKNNTSPQDTATLSAKSIIARKTAIQAADMQVQFLRKFNEIREENLNAMSQAISICIGQISSLIPECKSIHLLSEATKAIADAYRTIASINPEETAKDKTTSAVTNNFTSIIAQINTASTDEKTK